MSHHHRRRKYILRLCNIIGAFFWLQTLLSPENVSCSSIRRESPQTYFYLSSTWSKSNFCVWKSLFILPRNVCESTRDLKLGEDLQCSVYLMQVSAFFLTIYFVDLDRLYEWNTHFLIVQTLFWVFCCSQLPPGYFRVSEMLSLNDDDDDDVYVVVISPRERCSCERGWCWVYDGLCECCRSFVY